MELVDGESSLIDMLTAREYEVFCFLIKGKNTSEIANTLSISKKTVATYQTNIKKKLGVSNPYSMVRIALNAGMSFD